MIFFNARSGSTFFLDLLNQSRSLGSVEGLWFGNPSHHQYSSLMGIQLAFNGYVDHNRGVDGIAYRTSWAWLDRVYDTAGFAAQQWILSRATHVIFLDRYDKTRQAVSWYIAEHSKKWGSNDRMVNDPPRFSYDGIHTLRSTIVGTSIRTREWMGRQEIPTLVLTYEEWVKKPSEMIGQVAQFIGRPLNKNIKTNHNKEDDLIKAEFLTKTLELDKIRRQVFY